MILSPPTSADGGGKLLRAILTRGKLALIVPSCIGLVLGYVGYANTPPRYNSEAVLVLDARHIQVLPTASVVSPLPQDSPVLRSELDIINSHLVASKVIRRLGLTRDDLARLDGHQSLPARLLNVVRGLLAKRDRPAPAERPDEILQGQLLSNLRVSNDGRSYTIFISYTAGDPDLAAKIANAFAASYLDYQVEIQGVGTRQVSEWIGDKLVNLRTTLENSERALNSFRAEANLVGANGTTSQVQRVTDAESQAMTALAALERDKLRLATATRQMDENGQPAVPEMERSSLFDTLRSERYRIERRITELTDGGATMSAELPSLKSQLATIRQQWTEANRRILNGLAADVEISERSYASAEKNLEDARAELGAANKALVQEAQLEREATANRTIYESYLARYKETIEQEGIAAPDAAIISAAQPSPVRSSPRLQNWLTLGLVLGGLMGLALAFLRVMTDRRITSAEMLADYTGHPVLGAIPPCSPGAARIRGKARSMARPTAAMAETLAMIRFTPMGRKARVIAITSHGSGEGKTTITVELARALAATGTSVLAIDCNLARPDLAQKFALTSAACEKAPGANGRDNEASAAIDTSGVVIMKAEALQIHHGPLVSGPHLREEIAKLRERFDVILLDSPALSQTLDAWQLAAMAEGVIMVVDRSSSHIDRIKASLDRLDEYGCQVLGSIVNRLPSQPIFPHALREPTPERRSKDDARGGAKVYEFPEAAQSTW